MTDSDLIRALRQRDPAAYQQVMDRYLRSLWRYVYMKVDRDEHLTEDIVSETMLALVQAVTPDNAANEGDSRSETTIENIGGWLRGVASNKVNDFFRAASRVRHLIEDARKTLGKEAHPVDAQHVAETEERRGEVRDVMDELPDQYRIALEWKYLDKVSVRDIADRLGVTEKAAESVLFRARREFREKLERVDREQELPSRVNGQQPARESRRSGSDGTASQGQAEEDWSEVNSSEINATGLDFNLL